MEPTDVKKILESVASGDLAVDDAMIQLRIQPFSDLGFAGSITTALSGPLARSSTARARQTRLLRLLKIFITMERSRLLITRMSKLMAQDVKCRVVELDDAVAFFYDASCGLAQIGEALPKKKKGLIVVATGGTSDQPIAEEAALTAEFFGNNVVRLYDVGVAGLHRLLSNVETLMRARVVVAIAGMEGALASVIGGLVDCPVIAVPTSVGYGASLNGLAALLSMLNSCATGVSVVNIDNGFGAGYLANMINGA